MKLISVQSRGNALIRIYDDKGLGDRYRTQFCMLLPPQNRFLTFAQGWSKTKDDALNSAAQWLVEAAMPINAPACINCGARKTKACRICYEKNLWRAKTRLEGATV